MVPSHRCFFFVPKFPLPPPHCKIILVWVRVIFGLITSGAQAAQRAAKQNTITNRNGTTHMHRNVLFFMVNMVSNMDHGHFDDDISQHGDHTPAIRSTTSCILCLQCTSLIMDMIGNGQSVTCQNKVSTDQYHDCIAGSDLELIKIT